MGNTSKVNVATVFSLAGAFIAFAIGSGFSTGQEILQYFTAYGMESILIAAAILIAYIFILIEFLLTGKREQFKRGGEIYKYYCGKHIGAFYDYFTAIFVYMSYVVMVGGASATLNQYYALPRAVGGVLLGVVVGITVTFGLKSVVNIIGKIGPFIILICLLITIPSLFTGNGLNESLELLDEALASGTVLKASSTWYLAAWSYIGFGLLWYAPFFAGVGKDLKSEKEGIIAQTIGAAVFTITGLIVAFALLLHIDAVSGAQVPMLALANELSPVIGSVFAIIVMLAIYSSAVPLLWSSMSPFVDDTTKKGKICILIAAFVGIVIALALPFDKLLNLIYVLNGYLGGFLILFVAVKVIKRRSAAKE